MVTLVGEDVVLPCSLEPPLDAVSKSVEWARPDLEPRFVHVWHDGQDHMVNQNPSYKGRTSVSIDKLRQGDLSLLLSAVKLSDYGLYRCYFPSQNKTFSVELIVAGIFSITPPSSHSVIVAIVSGIAAGLAIAVVFVWKWKKTQTTKRKDSSDKKDQLRKQSMKIQEELSAWGEVFSPLMELKTGVVNQRETLRLQLEEIENEREENKEKIQSVEKKIAESEQEKATDRTEGYLREKQNLLKANWKLEKRKEEVEKQQLNMDKLLQKADSMNVTVTDRKRKVENQMEVIKSFLGELESDDENTHLHRD
uniref:Ig-like domain-containing protein n=1 Tax=Sparus aurata TaxID=8175 RepID=A0A671TP60_SPAAU